MRFLLLFSLLSPAVSGLLTAQSEKQPDDGEFTVRQEMRAGIWADSLDGASTYNRIFTDDVDPDCNATSSFSGVGVGVPYLVRDIHTYNPDGENLVCSVNVDGTDLVDSVLSLYCAPFDPSDASANLVAYDDDGGFGLLSAFTEADGAFIKPGQRYCLVISIFGPPDLGGGNFQVDIDGDIVIGNVVDIPVLQPWGLAILVSALAGAAVFLMKRRRQDPVAEP